MAKYLYVVALIDSGTEEDDLEEGGVRTISFAHAFVEAANDDDAYRLGHDAVTLEPTAQPYNDYVVQLDAEPQP